MQRVLLTFGTRPEAIKMAPVVRALRARPDLESRVCVTAQHRAMLDQVLALFDLTPDVDLDLMQAGQTPAQLTSRVIETMSNTLAAERPDVVLVHGDTTTAMATALAAFYLRIPVGHVEAGLRSGRMDAPFPEEMNRVVIDRVADRLFAPTSGAAANLAREGVDAARTLVTGNTAIDALLDVRARLADLPVPLRDVLDPARRMILVTAHRRESFGAPLASVFDALETIARRHPEIDLVYPVHPNPQVEGPARERLSAPNLRLIEPVDYGSLVWLLDRAHLVLTDSGGIQEEGATLGKPLLVLRDVTERPELVEAGAGRLVGTDCDRILEAVEGLLATRTRGRPWRAPARSSATVGPAPASRPAWPATGRSPGREPSHLAAAARLRGGGRAFRPCSPTSRRHSQAGPTRGRAGWWWSTTARPTTPRTPRARRARPRASRSGSSSTPRTGGWAPPCARASSTSWARPVPTTCSSRWTPTTRIRPSSCPACSPASTTAPTSSSPRASSPAPPCTAWTARASSTSVLASWLLRGVFPGARDYTCGYRAYRVSLLRWGQSHYGPDFLNQPGFAVMVDLLLKLRRKARRIDEVPLTLRYDRKVSTSKMKIVQTALTTLALMGRRFRGDPRGP